MKRRPQPQVPTLGELTDPDGAFVRKDLGGGYSQLQLGPAYRPLPAAVVAELLDLPDPDRPPPERIHRVGRRRRR